MMNLMTESSPTTDKPAPPQRRIQRSTFVVAGLVLLLGVILNCGGNYDQEYIAIVYGWPWHYASHTAFFDDTFSPAQEQGVLYQWAPWHRESLIAFYGFSLVGNVLAVSVMVFVAAWLWEWRRRKVKRWYQFTIADWLMVTAGMVLCYASYERLYRDKVAFEQLSTKFKLLNTPLYCNLEEGMESVDGMYNWAWELLRLPYESRPYKVHDLSININDEREFKDPEENLDQPTISIPKTIWDDLSNFPHLQTCNLTIQFDWAKVEIPLDAFASLSRCPKLQEVQLFAGGDWFTDAHVFSLSKIRSLQALSLRNNPSFHGDRLSHLNRLTYLSIENTGLNDNGMAELAQLTQLQELHLAWNEEITSGGWADLENMKSLKRLNIGSHGFDGIGVKAIGNLTELEELDLTTWKAVSEDSWKALANLKKLQKLHIDCPTFDDQALAALENLSELKTLELDNTSLTRRAFATLKKMKGLHSLDMFNARNAPRIAYPHNSNLHIKIGESGLTAEDEIEFRAIVEPN
jgi:hypothetical protein